MKNMAVHIYPSNMRNESRIFKESKFMSKALNFDQILLLGIGEAGLKKVEKLADDIIIRRIFLFSVKKRAVLYLYYYLYVACFVAYHRPKMVNVHTLEFLPLTVLAKFFSITVIYDTHEYETEKSNLKGLRKKISKIIEKIFIRYCDRVIVVGHSIANEYHRLYPKIDKPYVVLNTPPLKAIEKANIFREKFAITNKQNIFLYQGGLLKNRGIEVLLKIFSDSDFINGFDRQPIIVFMGFGTLEGAIKEYAKKHPTIFFHEAVAPQNLLNYTSSADYGVCFVEDTCLSYRYCMPNKVFEYIMAGLPLVVSSLDELKRLVEQNQIGVVSKGNQMANFMQAIKQIQKMDKDKLKINLEKARATYNWEEQEKVLMQIYKGLSF